ncbi:MAG: xanthine dehydrogenase family protein molybdopterin-binding subunit, partial [Flavitalea sp.]
VITHNNRPSLAWFDLQYADLDAPPGLVFKPLLNDEIKFSGQPIALVIANDFETARYAANIMHITYSEEPFETSIHSNLDKARKPKAGMATLLKPPPPPPTGKFDEAYEASSIKSDTEYIHAPEHHNPLELFATTTVYDGKGKLTIYDKTQGTINNQLFVANVFGLKFKNVRVLAPFVGGGFGSGLRPQYQLFLCVMAALHLKRNVKLTLERKQMFWFPHRPESRQHLRFSTTDQGKLTAMSHNTISETSQFEDYAEKVSSWSHMLYPAPHTKFDYKLVSLDVPTPLDMRAPGGVTALHAIECMMDELSYKAGIDPLEFRLLNYSEIDSSTGKPFTSKALRECYLQGAEKFGWKDRNPVPGQTKRGNKLIGYGMATGMWDAFQFPSRVEMIIGKDGKLRVNSAVTDIGTGTLTIMTQIAADQLGLAIEDVDFSYGDSKKPFSVFQGGSATTSSTGVAIVMAAKKLKKKLISIARKMPDSKFRSVDESEIVFRNGSLILINNDQESVSLTELVQNNNNKPVSVINMAGPHMIDLRKYSLASHSAAFVEVEVDAELKLITVTRAVTAVAAGKIINPKTAGSQILGSMIWGISKALHEQSVMDENIGRYVNTNLGEYHIPVHADINKLDVIFVDEKDDLINELGTKGVGEVGIVAMPAAIANAVYHATGRRINDLPIHFDKLLD